jgi:hypothetical protein
MSMFLEDDDLVKLTGFKAARRQIEYLRNIGVAFRVNARGKPVVSVSAIDGSRPAAAAKREKVVPLLYR